MSEMTLFNVVVAAIIFAKCLNVIVFEPLLYKLKSYIYGDRSVSSGAKHQLIMGRTKEGMASSRANQE